MNENSIIIPAVSRFQIEQKRPKSVRTLSNVLNHCPKRIVTIQIYPKLAVSVRALNRIFKHTIAIREGLNGRRWGAAEQLPITLHLGPQIWVNVTSSD